MPQQAKPIQKATDLLPNYNGKTRDEVLPSGRKVEIRELNGDDEDIISNIKSNMDGSAGPNFLSSIIVKDYETGTKPTPEDINKWLINDKYALMLKQRIFNHGDIMKFLNFCDNADCNDRSELTEPLGKFDGDLSQKDYEPEFKQSLKKYPLGDQREVELELSSGKKVKYKLLTGLLEKKALEIKEVSKNAPLIIRELEIENQGQWLRVTHFGIFSAKEMKEIRSSVSKNDTQFDPMVRYDCPGCSKAYNESLFSIGAFFFPEDQI